MADPIFARHPAGAGISRCYHRTQDRRDDLGPLSQRSFSRIALRELAQLVSDRAFPSGSGIRCG